MIDTAYLAITRWKSP